MRERGLRLRERGHRAGDGFFARHRPTWVIAAGGAVVLGGVGAFGTGDAAPWTLYSYWLILMLAGAALGALALDRIPGCSLATAAGRGRIGAAILIVSVAHTPLVWVMAALAMGGSGDVSRLAHLFPQVLLVATFFVPLQFVLERLVGAAAVRPPMPAPGNSTPPLLARLPARLRGAELHAIEAEDHYLRIHTDRGSDLLLMRLGEAVDALAGLEGARTHRSWWVARAAVVAATRGRGRAQLRLKCGLTVPVSRSYAAGLRLSGWF